MVLDANSGVDSRKSTEWVLDPQFYSGVKSTTRYRRPHGGNRSRGTNHGHGKGARAGGAGNGVVGGSGAEGGSTSAASNARVSAGRRGGHVAAQNRKRNRAAEKQQQQQQQGMAPMAAARNVSHNNGFHHTAAVHPIFDPQHLGKGGCGGSGASAGFAYADHHLGYSYPTTSSPFNTSTTTNTTADFMGEAGPGHIPPAAAVARYDQETGDGRLLAGDYFPSSSSSLHYQLGLGEGGVENHHSQTLATENDNISEPTTPPPASVVVGNYGGSGGSQHHHPHHHKSETYLYDMGAATSVVAVSHGGYSTLTPATASYGGMQPRQQQQQQPEVQAYVGGAYEPRSGELPPHVFWDGDVPLASLSLDA